MCLFACCCIDTPVIVTSYIQQQDWMVRIIEYNPPPMGPDRCRIIKYFRLSDSTYTDPSSYRLFLLLSSENVHMLFSFHHKKTALAIISPVTCFPLECIAVNHLYNTLSNCTNLGSFNLCCLQRSFFLALDAINDSNWTFSFFIP